MGESSCPISPSVWSSYAPATRPARGRRRSIHAPCTSRGKTGIDWQDGRWKLSEAPDGVRYAITACDRARYVCPVCPGQHNSPRWARRIRVEQTCGVREQTGCDTIAPARRSQTGA
jgi:hypothetical protein